MFLRVLLPESVTRQDGSGPEIELEEGSRTLLLTLGITRMLENEILNVSVWGSADSREWKELAAFPRKFYCGKYSMAMDVRRHPEVRYIRAQWQMGTWDMQEPKALFGFYLHAEELRVQHAGAA